MRIAAGILLVLGGTIAVPPIIVRMDNPLVLLILLWPGFVITGGIFCLKRRFWGLCLAAAILTFGLLPIIFVCSTKREWLSQLPRQSAEAEPD